MFNSYTLRLNTSRNIHDSTPQNNLPQYTITTQLFSASNRPLICANNSA